jgi:ceramide glucosyltransferase
LIFRFLCAVNFLNEILAAFAILSVALLLWQFFAARKFPLHKKIADPHFAPAISILKPLKGCDETTAASLESWFKQNYSGPIQILFGVADANDPVCQIVQELLQKNPRLDAQLVICAENLGANAKVSTLAQLEKLAKHDLILASDADVRVPPDFLANFVAPLRDEKTGLVNCFYRLANPTTTAMHWEAIAINADFWSMVLQSQTLQPLDFALGAAILLRRKNLKEIGGFISLANCLADDYQLGNRIFKNGNSIALCPVVVECWDAPANWSEVWKHQLRWARTIRVCQPLPYFFSILSNATLWPLLWLISELPKLSATVTQSTKLAGMQVSATSIALPNGMVIAATFCLLRVIIACLLQKRSNRSVAHLIYFWLVPVKDLLQVVIWLCAFAGNTVEWRGKKMKLRRDGTLEW